MLPLRIQGLVLAFVSTLLFGQSTPPPPASKPPGSFDDSHSAPSGPLHSVGVRGTIDAGGYAASAPVKTQAELYVQLIDLQIAELRPAWAPQDPCADSNPLRRPAIRKLSGGEFAQAADALEPLLRTQDNPATRQLLGLAYEGTGQLEAAAEQFRVASAAQPDERSLYAYGAALLLLGDLNRAEAVFRQPPVRGSSTALRLGLGAALFQGGKVVEALRVFLDAATERPSETAPFQFVAIALRSAAPETLAEIIDRLECLARLSPQNGTAHYALACALISAAGGAPGEVRSAGIEAQLKQAIALGPLIADAHFRLAASYAARENLQGAIAEYQAALNCNPRLADAHYRLSQIYSRSGEPQLAKEQLQLHQQIRAQQKAEVESGKVLVRITETATAPCS